MHIFQGDRERTMGLPVLSHMDRHSTTKPKIQIGFIKFVLVPFFTLISQVKKEFVFFKI